MRQRYSSNEIAKMIGISPDTVKNWEANLLIPQADRVGLQKKRLWSQSQVLRILEYAADIGYYIPDSLIQSMTEKD